MFYSQDCAEITLDAADFHLGYWKMNIGASQPPTPVGQAHKLDLLLALTQFNMVSLWGIEPRPRLFRHTLQWS